MESGADFTRLWIGPLRCRGGKPDSAFWRSEPWARVCSQLSCLETFGRNGGALPCVRSLSRRELAVIHQRERLLFAGAV